VGVGAPHEGQVEEPRELEVVHVAGLALDQAGVFHPPDVRSDEAWRGHYPTVRLALRPCARAVTNAA